MRPWGSPDSSAGKESTSNVGDLGSIICGGFSCGTGALRHTGFSSFGSWAYLLCSMWDLPRPGIEPRSPAMAGGVWTSEPPGKCGGAWSMD